MKKCPFCGKDNADKAERCERCSAGFHTGTKETNEQEPVSVLGRRKNKEMKDDGT